MHKETIIDEQGATAFVVREWLPKKEANELLGYLEKEIKWEQHLLTIYGKVHPEPRETYVMGTLGIVHKYSGTSRPLKQWDDKVKVLFDKINKEYGSSIDSCLLNKYNTGAQYILAHSDKETKPPKHFVATISLGGSRDFHFIRKSDKEKIKIQLHSGDLCIMEGRTQELFLHTVPKRAHADLRISLTGRELGK